MKSAARFRKIFLNQLSRHPLWRGRCPGRHGDADLGKEIFLPGRRADAEQPNSLFRSVSERVRRVGGDAYGFAGSHDRLLTAEGSFDLAFEDCERFFKVMPMRTW